jgi:hypothetical protein
MRARVKTRSRWREARQAGHALALVATVVVVAGIHWASTTRELVAYLLVSFASLLPALLWIRGGALGIPVLPAVAFLHILYFAIPIARGGATKLEYPEEAIWSAGLTVTGFLLAATLSSQFVLLRPRPRAWAPPALATDRQLPVLIVLGLGSGLSFHACIILGIFGFLGPFFGVVRAVALTAITLSCYLLGVARARGLLFGRRWYLALTGFSAAVLLNWSSFFLVGGLIYGLAAILGYISTKKQVPWLVVSTAFVLVAILHAGKSEMRAKYWEAGSNSSSIGSVLDVPGIAVDWVAAGVKALVTDADAASVIERASLSQMLLRVQRLTPSFIPFLEGETYALLPKMLVPRFLSPNKTASQAAMDLLNIRYGLLSVEGAAATAIGWGLIAEGYANFGQMGVIGVGLVLGLVCGLLMSFSKDASALSRPTLLAIVGMMCLINLEADMAGLVTNMSQSAMAILIYFGVFRLVRGRGRPAVTSKSSAPALARQQV